jgi:hypothetical protein
VGNREGWLVGNLLGCELGLIKGLRVGRLVGEEDEGRDVGGLVSPSLVGLLVTGERVGAELG